MSNKRVYLYILMTLIIVVAVSSVTIISSKAASLEGTKITDKKHTYQLETFYTVMSADSESNIPTDEGICKINNKDYYYVKDGNIVTDANGVIKVLGNFVLLENGKVQISKSGLYLYKYDKASSWVYINNGIFDFEAAGFAKYNKEHIYIKNGKYDKIQTGLFKHQSNGKIYYVENSVVKKINGLINDVVNDITGFWYVKNGSLDTGFSGIYVGGDDSVWKEQLRYYIQNGKENIRRSSAMIFALKYVGNPYKYGGTDLEKGIDCSAFVQKIYGSTDVQIDLPRKTSDQIYEGEAVKDLSSAKPGDLIFYGKGSKYSSVTHVALYLGNNKIIHASNKKDGIKVSKANYKKPLAIKTFKEIDKELEK